MPSDHLWAPLGATPPTTLRDARVQLHWAAQCLSAVADALLSRELDDSQSNLEWSPALGALVGRRLDSGHRVALRLLDPTLLVLGPRGGVVAARRLIGQTLRDTLSWLSGLLAEVAGKAVVALKTREYDMPEHDVDNGVAFGTSSAHTHAIARWFSNAHTALSAFLAGQEQHKPLRVWPHHFDLGSVLPLEDSTRSIGIGMSPGDADYEEPYFYVTMWPIPTERGNLPSLPVGRWHTDAYLGAILTASEIVPHQQQGSLVSTFLTAAVASSRALVKERT